jgi:hypothetical protein
MARFGAWARLASTPRRPREAPPGFDFTTNVMRADTDAICPRCLTWVKPTDYVRRTAYGVIQHETCCWTAPNDLAKSSRA